MVKTVLTVLGIILILLTVYIVKRPSVGDTVDEFNGVKVFFNGVRPFQSHGRNLSADGYNIGQKYQCVEFIKRYYYEVYGHKMPESYGHAVNFYDKTVADGELNKARGLMQYNNPSMSSPKAGDLIVFDKKKSNRYGHVAIVTKVNGEVVEIIQQNTFSSRGALKLYHQNDKWLIGGGGVLGWLRLDTSE